MTKKSRSNKIRFKPKPETRRSVNAVRAEHRKIALAEAEKDKSDPFVYGRVMAHLKFGCY